MNAELKAKWVAALRSGKYRQAHMLLRDTSEARPAYCCLGVLCEISGGMSDAEWELLRYSLTAPAIVRAGLSDPKTTGMAWPAKEVADMNDRGDSFEKIAAYIEANIKSDEPAEPPTPTSVLQVEEQISADLLDGEGR